MGILSFRSPQDGIEHISKALDLVSNIANEIVRNPDMGNIIQDLSKKLSDAQELSETKKQMALDADEKILKARKEWEILEKEKLDHAIQVKNNLEELKALQIRLENSQNAHAKEKESLQEYVIKIKNEADEKLDLAKRLNDEALARHKIIVTLENSHAKSVSDLKESKSKHEIEVKKLLDEQNNFELRKKRFEDALRG